MTELFPERWHCITVPIESSFATFADVKPGSIISWKFPDMKYARQFEVVRRDFNRRKIWLRGL